MLVRFLPLVLVSLTLGCLVGASGEERSSGSGSQFESAAKAGSSSVASIQVATVTPIPESAASRLLVPVTPTATPTSSPEPTATQVAALVAPTEVVVLPTDTPVPTEAPATETPLPTETPVPSMTPTPTESPVPSPTPTATARPSLTPTQPSTGGLSGVESQLFIAHNDFRTDRDLPKFRQSGTLFAIARERAEIMANSVGLSHYNPDGSTVFGMMSARGYSFTDGSENIHYNYGWSPQQSWGIAMDEWVNSPPHYASMVKPTFLYIGIGVATAPNGDIYYSVVFSD